MTSHRYTTVAIVLHWLIAALLVFQVSLGWRMEDLNGTAGFSAFQLHKSLGVTILVLSLLRLAWRLTHCAPPQPEHAPGWEKLAAKTTHIAFYVLLIGLPLTGWAVVSASRLNIPTLLYGVIPWPHLPGFAGLAPAAKEAAEELFSGGHEILVFCTLALLALHLGAVLKHQFIDRDEVLGHMAPGAQPGRRIEPRLVGALAGLAVAAALPWLLLQDKAPLPAAVAPEPVAAAPAIAAAPDATTPEATPAEVAEEEAPAAPSVWTVQRAGSALEFTADWGGAPINGSFKDWSADILFSPDALEESRLTVTVKVASAITGDEQRDSSLSSAEWFDAAAHPDAVFTAQRFRKTGADSYQAMGRLRLHGVSAPVTLPFTLKIDGDAARASGSLTLDRQVFGVGGSPEATEGVAYPVKVAFRLNARRRP